MTQHSLLAIAGRTAFVYLLMLVMIRVLGKRAVGNLTAFDMLIALIMGDLAGYAIYGDAPLVDALVAIGALSGLHYANSWITYRLPRFAARIEGRATVIVRSGQLVRAGMRQERMNADEVLAELRLQGIDDLDEVRLAQVESDGQVSVLREASAEPVRKWDLEPGS